MAELRKAQMSDQEKALDAARNEGRTEVETRLRERIVVAEVKAQASASSVDPSLVAMLVDRSKLKWDGDALDEESVTKQIDKVLAERPILRRAEPGQPPVPTVPSGRRSTTEPDPGQMSMAEYIAWRKQNPHA